MPSANPLSLRRSATPPTPPQQPAAPGRTAPARSPEQKRSADAVYTFLTDFSAGVQRGLDESHRPPT
jgi:hypothetical protein